MEQTDAVTHDDALVRRAQDGDKSAFASLYQAHVGRVYAICLRMVANEARAVELTQQTFVRAWQRLDTFRSESAFSSWLYRVAVNIVLVDLRTRRRRKARIEVTDDLTAFDSPDGQLSLDTAMDLEQAIQSLPPRARSVLVLHDLEGYRHHEIATMMDIAPGTSKAHLHRARQLLKTFLDR